MNLPVSADDPSPNSAPRDETGPTHGARWRPGEGTTFRLWAPAQPSVDLVIDGRPKRRMRVLPEGWHEDLVPEAGPGTLYRFGLADGLMVPDPASRFQPSDVHGPSEVIDPAAYAWQDAAWRGRPWPETILYELHIGAFTPQGTFRGAIEKLDHLVALGINAIEIMPIADFSGTRNWGYDGVLPYAPDSSYGRPEDLQALVDAAHGRGLSVLLDVVYNHLGPDGNYLHVYAPGFFTDRHKTPWGAAINFDGPHSRPVRDFFIRNALSWIEDFHIDGLRLDAVHAIVDDGRTHLLDELAARIRTAVTDRPIHLVVEDEDNVASRLVRGEDHRPHSFTAQWNDDVHHVLHVAASHESVGYYAEYLGDTALLGRALAEGFAFQGQMMHYRGRARGEPSAGLPPDAFVAFIQNHDQIGNRAFGERIGALVSPEALRAITAVYLLLPQVPMLFMGEEWAASTPFLFFCDFHGELAEAVRNGRRAEFARFPAFQDATLRASIPDPQAEATFEASKLLWAEAGTGQHAETLRRTTALLALRARSIVPLIDGLSGKATELRCVGPAAVAIIWQGPGGAQLRLEANLKPEAEPGFAALAQEWPRPAEAATLWQEGQAEASAFGPWAVRWSLSDAAAAPERSPETSPA